VSVGVQVTPSELVSVGSGRVGDQNDAKFYLQSVHASHLALNVLPRLGTGTTVPGATKARYWYNSTWCYQG